MDGKVTIEEFNTLMGITAGIADDTDIKFRNVKKSLEELMGIDWIINIEFKSFGDIPDPGGFAEKGWTTPVPKTNTPKPPGWKYQHGGSFTVPSGFPNDSYFAPLALSSGEHVQVTPKGGGRGAGNTYNYVRYGDRNIVTEPAQAAFLVEKQRQAQFDEIDKVI